ncbi:ABC transporter transmembrane domain-containing protein [Pukyongiella litopenaei]|uniref:Cyclic nucleotide-binding domain-containing protein n=1 Tax=Pukyongiella litopenaei TaxID=2605946 RepID=A0A2S0MN48_9RHOB|nr:ABC transporter transmembrane domain-containing protein [Pukyongiella litopenaei]AVO37266.1 cyclic nucleotide-binding domain-containing protein [Pukyongiella litopenaei]
MEPTLFSFIWKNSKRQQLVLLLLTLISFPFLYASLELPKRIINDAIGAPGSVIPLYGFEVTQVQYLLLLSFAFLGAVLASGLMKMRINTMKGVLAERLLRRLRYTLIARTMRFPKPYFRSTSQGELVSMITSEAEPMGGLMGDAVAQPVFQAGQMLTIVAFLFVQSLWFGLAAVALIPLQAWLIPRLQRQINLLNKERIGQVRHLSAEIGESAAGISDLRANGGWRYRMAQFTDRLGKLFDIRFRIYRKKFFMKFLNNLITQMTPFLFYSIGGLLAIRGDITVGALVAALAAYKDLSSPWKELLYYYNQVQDMSLRWQIVTERFAPANMIDEALFENDPEDLPRLDGAIELHDVTVRDQDGNTVLEDIDLTIPPQSRVAIQCRSPAERAALAELLTREVLPARGSVVLSGQPLATMHQATIAARIGHAHSRPYLFDGTLGDNLMMPLRLRPQEHRWDPGDRDRRAAEARRSGNSADPLDGNWIDPGLAGLTDDDDIREWWFSLNEAMGIDDFMVRRSLRSQVDPAHFPALAREIVGLRDEVHDRLRDRGLDRFVYRFDPDRFNPAIPLGGNLLFASPARSISQESLAASGNLIRLMEEQGLAEEGLSIAKAVMGLLNRTFGRDGTDHPLFRRLGMEEDTYYKLTDIAEKCCTAGDVGLTEAERALLLTVPFLLTAEQIGPGFPEKFKQRILEIRQTRAEELRRRTGDLFVRLTPEIYAPRLTLLENAIYGRVSMMAGARAREIEDTVVEVLAAHDLRDEVAATVFDLRAGIGGANLPTVFQERAAFSRAAIKRPDILILDRVLASHDAASRATTRERLRGLMPRSTIIFMEDRFENPQAYDMFVEIRGGRIDGISRSDDGSLDEDAAADLKRKQQIIADTPLFARLDTRSQRLLAFSANWYNAAPEEKIFAAGDAADAAYLCLNGRAELRWPDPGNEAPITVIEPGRVIGDLSIITGDNRALDLVATEPSCFLRIGAEEFREVMENDTTVAVGLLETVASHLTGAAGFLRGHKGETAPAGGAGDAQGPPPPPPVRDAS